MIDLDDFKKYNDYFGHIKGDWLLQEITNAIKNELPKNGFLSRYGGEEFTVILTNTNRIEAFKVAEHMRRVVEERKFAHPKSNRKIMTCSIGIATLTSDNIYENEVKFVDAADKMLYKAKELGKNKVV